eukprot:scaffold13544_cov50-Attheya_sp.AAC.1
MRRVEVRKNKMFANKFPPFLQLFSDAIDFHWRNGVSHLQELLLVKDDWMMSSMFSFILRQLFCETKNNVRPNIRTMPTRIYVEIASVYQRLVIGSMMHANPRRTDSR